MVHQEPRFLCLLNGNPTRVRAPCLHAAGLQSSLACDLSLGLSLQAVFCLAAGSGVPVLGGWTRRAQGGLAGLVHTALQGGAQLARMTSVLGLGDPPPPESGPGKPRQALLKLWKGARKLFCPLPLVGFSCLIQAAWGQEENYCAVCPEEASAPLCASVSPKHCFSPPTQSQAC